VFGSQYVDNEIVFPILPLLVQMVIFLLFGPL
jgi:hypothetical protein